MSSLIIKDFAIKPSKPHDTSIYVKPYLIVEPIRQFIDGIHFQNLAEVINQTSENAVRAFSTNIQHLISDINLNTN